MSKHCTMYDYGSWNKISMLLLASESLMKYCLNQINLDRNRTKLLFLCCQSLSNARLVHVVTSIYC